MTMVDAKAQEALMASLRDTNASLRETVQAMSGVMAQMHRREQSLKDLINQQLQALHDAVNSADRNVQRVVESAMPRLTQLSQQALATSLEPATERFQQRLASSDQTLQQASDRYVQAQRSHETAAMRRMRLASIAMLTAGLLGLGGAGVALYSAKSALAEASQRRKEIDYLDRVIRTDLVPCGEDRLCGNVDPQGTRYGDQKQYQVLELRK